MRGRIIRSLLPLTLAGVLGVGAAVAATSLLRSGGGTVKTAQSAKYGPVLVSSSGRTLYRFTADRKGKSTCKGECASSWPALTVKAGSKPTAGTGVKASMLGTMKRSSGAPQVTYGGYPLYLYSGDAKAGETSGEGTDGKWFVVSSSGALVKHATSSGSGSTTSSTTTTTKKTGWG